MRLWLVCVLSSLAVTVLTFWGIGGLIHYWFYVRRRERAGEWKLQPARWLSRALTRHAFALGSVSILVGSIVGATFTWYVLRGGRSSLYFDWRARPLWYAPLSGLLVYFAIDAGLYYSHRLLHHRLLFRHLHRWHHRYVSPIVFTTTASHPVEFLIFQFFLILPAFVIPVHVTVYLIVIGYTYLIGMIDHTGIRVNWGLPLHASNQFHDDHHVYFHCNYGHHTSLFDRLHGTVRRLDRRYDEHTFGGRGAPVEKS
ncbi:MAG TPA: sterol desaturase family protein [Polyangia bacterium]|nr:sterol desaturase family protein [Polyangia bacterium]